MKTEKDLHLYVKKRCGERGVLCHKLESRSGRGFPDLMLVRGGGIVFVELKSPSGTGRLSSSQQNCIAELRGAGAVVSVVDSVEEVDRVIEGLCT